MNNIPTSSSRRRPLVHGRTAVYHVISRTTCKQFLLGEREKETFRRMLHRHAAFHGVEVLTYCILSNHFHLLLRIPHAKDLSDCELLDRYRAFYNGPHGTFSMPSPASVEAIFASGGDDAAALRKRLKTRMFNLPVFMRELKQSFAIWYNRSHQNFGTIWAAKYKSLIVEDAPQALCTVAAYIDLNPVRAGLTKDPGSYRWCGYADAIGGSTTAKAGLCSLFSGGNQTWKYALPAYRTILFGKGRVAKGTPGKDTGRISPEVADKVEQAKGELALNKLLQHRIRYFSDGMVLGSREFLESYFEANREQFGPKRKTGPRKMRGADWGALHVMRDLQEENI